MTKETIKISGDNASFLSVSLLDILSLIRQGEYINWSILNIRNLTWDSDRFGLVSDLESQINQSPFGLILSWDDLLSFSKKIEQVNEITIVGNKGNKDMKHPMDEKDLFDANDCVIELIDSSYWVVHGSLEVTDLMKKNLEGVEAN